MQFAANPEKFSLGKGECSDDMLGAIEVGKRLEREKHNKECFSSSNFQKAPTL
jgi:hypothetical protein